MTIENTHRILTEDHRPLSYATLHGAAEIAVPTLVSTLAISCVFTSVVFLEGPAKYLFTPLGLAVVFAMLASYGLSRTLTPITIGLLLKGERHAGPGVVPTGLFAYGAYGNQEADIATGSAENGDLPRALEYLAQSGSKFLYFVSRETVDPKARLHARMLFYNGEDPATGSAAGCCASWMVAHGVAASDEHVMIEQGLEMHRPSRIFVRATKKDNHVINVRVGGNCVEVLRGELTLSNI